LSWRLERQSLTSTRLLCWEDRRLDHRLPARPSKPAVTT